MISRKNFVIYNAWWFTVEFYFIWSSSDAFVKMIQKTVQIKKQFEFETNKNCCG